MIVKTGCDPPPIFWKEALRFEERATPEEFWDMLFVIVDSLQAFVTVMSQDGVSSP
ncbi:hypothetical protein [Methanofollis formosanus]|uniref:hypothetical protein n=1 Tax=Methanofollis formosanus TaxID=299308 RepID=UPI001C7CC3FD|nr:hypothetical protein [Methanofollis formosanus]